MRLHGWSTTAHQRQVARPLPHQPRGDRETKPPQPAGHEVGRVGADVERALRRRLEAALAQACHVARASAQRDLGLEVGSFELRQELGRPLGAPRRVEVHERTAELGVLELERAAEAPKRRRRDARDARAPGPLRAARHDAEGEAARAGWSVGPPGPGTPRSRSRCADRPGASRRSRLPRASRRGRRGARRPCRSGRRTPTRAGRRRSLGLVGSNLVAIGLEHREPSTRPHAHHRPSLRAEEGGESRRRDRSHPRALATAPLAPSGAGLARGPRSATRPRTPTRRRDPPPAGRRGARGHPRPSGAPAATRRSGAGRSGRPPGRAASTPPGSRARRPRRARSAWCAARRCSRRMDASTRPSFCFARRFSSMDWHQDRVRAHLDEQRVPVRHEPLHRRREEHRLPQVLRPVARVELGALQRRAGHRRPHRAAAPRAAARSRERRQELRAQGVHLRAVRRHVHLHAPAEHAPRLQRRQHLVERRRDLPRSPSTAGRCSPRRRAGPRSRPAPAPRPRSVSSTSAIAPCPLTRLSSRLRRQITVAASSSASAPATYAAATSPMLCPTTASGSTPHERQSAASATSIANSTGCTTSISSSCELASSAPELLQHRRTRLRADRVVAGLSASRKAGSLAEQLPRPCRATASPGRERRRRPWGAARRPCRRRQRRLAVARMLEPAAISASRAARDREPVLVVRPPHARACTRCRRAAASRSARGASRTRARARAAPPGLFAEMGTR